MSLIEKQTKIRRYRVRGVGDKGSWYEAGIYYTENEKNAIEQCKEENQQFLGGLRLIAEKIQDRVGM